MENKMENMVRFFIAVPHQMPAQEWFTTDEPLEEHDQFIEGDHDLFCIHEINCWQDVQRLMVVWGHQGIAVARIARQIGEREWPEMFIVDEDEDEDDDVY